VAVSKAGQAGLAIPSYDYGEDGSLELLPRGYEVIVLATLELVERSVLSKSGSLEEARERLRFLKAAVGERVALLFELELGAPS